MTENEKMKMVSRIKERREQLGYTQEAFSELVNTSYSTYTKIENNFQNLTLDRIVVIAEKLHVSIDYLVYGREEDKLKDTELLKRLLESVDKDKLKHTCDFLSDIIKM